jgi:hypothetical protein
MSLAEAKQVLKNKTLKSCRVTKVINTYTADGAIALASEIAILSKTSAAAMTLAAPLKSQDGQELTVTAGTAYAHVVTATNLIEDGVTGGAKDTITLGAFVGASATLIALGGKWHLKSVNVATIAGA